VVQGVDDQLQCSNITCTANQSLPFTSATRAECLAVGAAAVDEHRDKDTYPEYLRGISSTTTAAGAGANSMLFNGMVSCYLYLIHVAFVLSTSREGER
jgi:hypothetical protein